MSCNSNGYYTVQMTPNYCCSQPEYYPVEVPVPMPVPVPVKPEVNIFSDNRTYPTTINNTTNNTYVTKNYNFNSNSTYTTIINNFPDRQHAPSFTSTTVGSKAQQIFDNVRTSHSTKTTSSCTCNNKKPNVPQHRGNRYSGSLFDNFFGGNRGGNIVAQQNGRTNYASIRNNGRNIIAQQNGNYNYVNINGYGRTGNTVVQQNGNSNYASIGDAFMRFSDRYKG